MPTRRSSAPPPPDRQGASVAQAEPKKLAHATSGKRSSVPPPPDRHGVSVAQAESKKSIYAILGNGFFTPMPLLNPETGEKMAVVDKKWLENFKDENYDQYGRMMDFVEMVRYVTGMKLHELEEMATSKPPEMLESINATREKILNLFSCNTDGKNPDRKLCFLAKYVPEKRNQGLHRLGRLADEYINEVISQFFPGYEHELSLKNEVSTCNDAAQLLFMIFDTNRDIRLRYEARRKLILMKMIGELENYSEEDEEHENALSYMIGFLNDKMVTLHPGELAGASFERFLVSAHSIKTDKKKNEPDHETIYAEIKTKPIKKRKKDLPEENAVQRITSIGMRRATVADFDGNEREIFFYTIPREKDINSRLTKKIIRNKEITEPEDDRHGIRMIFETKQDQVDFFRLLKKKMQSEGDTIIITDEKDNSDGLGAFPGGCESSNPDLKVYKFKTLVTKKDGGSQRFEFQIFFPDGFADYYYRRDVIWAEYKVNCFYDTQLDEILFPSQIFSELNRDDIRTEAKRRAFDQTWDKNAIQFQERRISINHPIDPE